MAGTSRACSPGRHYVDGLPYAIADPARWGGRSAVRVARRPGDTPTRAALPIRGRWASLVFVQSATGEGRPTIHAGDQTHFPRESSELLGFYEIRYEDDLVATHEIRYDETVGRWDAGLALPFYFARPLVAGTLPDGRAAVVWASEWANPRPDVPIASVTLVGSPGPSKRPPDPARRHRGREAAGRGPAVSAPAIVSPFSLLDGAIAVLSLLATLWIGLRVKRYIGTIEDYLVANRGMGLYVGAASLLSTEVGIITYMYQAQFGFVAGFSAFVTGLITLAVCLLVGRTGFVITRLREMEILHRPRVLRDDATAASVRVLAGVLMAFGGSLNLGIFPIIEARFLAVVTGIPSQYLGWTMAALLVVALAYTALGGMVSLIVTNYVQYVFLAAGTVIVTLACLRHVGWSGMVGAVEGHMGGHGFNPIEDLGVGFILWQVLLWIALMTVWQSVAMRTFSTKDAAVGKKMFTLTGFLFLGRALIPMVWGIAALAFFWGRAEPVATPAAATQARADGAARRAARRDLPPGPRRGAPRAGAAAGGPPRAARPRGEGGAAPEAARFEDAARDRRGEIGLLAMPWMLAATLPTGLLGLVVAGMLAASISTYAGYFLGWSSIIAQDIVAPLSGRRALEPVPAAAHPGRRSWASPSSS